ncbi:magnetosome-associated protein MamJ-like [Hemicordylus capensis]|uniref:magnetosome-associated protein MamJ-like n=1 Tax=Hemicordylus capensis TaxID=884348 RepID=UPI002303A514|nr:magnetosome-associated protein MamJ-like [Hemicordylus capensis]XP_053140095.1 magnetosome-associated protein MamJ-like [Hemicordylus capensis]
MGGCWSCVACRSHPEAEPKDEDEEGALTGHPRNPTHVAPFSGGLPSVLGHTLGKELIEEPSMPEPLPAPHITNNILEEELTEEPSVPEPLPAPGMTNDILEEELTEEPSVPEPLPAPGMTNDILEEELTEEPSVPEPLPAPGMTNDILEEELTEEPSVPEPLPAPRITNEIMEEELIEETSMPEPLPTPCITNDLLGKVLIEDTSVPGPSILTDTPKEAASVSEPLLEPSIADNYLQQEVELLKELQHDYVQQQLRVRRISQQFPRSLRAINLQIGHTWTRLIRSEVRLQQWEREGMFTAFP